MTPLLLASAGGYDLLLNVGITGLTNGFLFALIALGYTMVYGIVELINFAHGDLFMLGCFLAWTLVGLVTVTTGTAAAWLVILMLLVATPLFCAALNATVFLTVYRPQRGAPKLNLLVSAIGVSFVFMNIGQIWGGSQDLNFPRLLPDGNLLGEDSNVQLMWADMMVIVVTLVAMVLLTLFVKLTPLGKAMRATAQNPTAAALMGINVNRVITMTFVIGGALAGIASVIFAMKIKTIGWDMGFKNGLYAFTAAVLGGIGNVTGAVIGALIIGLVRALSDAYFDAQWTETVVFGILILILIFRPSGLLGAHTREKV